VADTTSPLAPAQPDRESQPTTGAVPQGVQTAAPGLGGGGGAALLHRLQASAGNAGVTRLLQRNGEDSSGGAGAPAQSAPQPGTQDSSGGAGPPPDVDFKKLIADKDTSGIRGIADYHKVEPGDRIKMIEILLDNTWWIGWTDRRAMVGLWDAWGEAGIADVYAQNQPLWDRCVAAKMSVTDIGSLKKFQDNFESDVKAVALAHLSQNAKLVKAEIGKLGTGGVDDVLGVGGSGPAPPPGKEIEEVQQLAREVQRADDAIEKLKLIPVGMSEPAVPVKNPDGTGGGSESGGGPPNAGAPPAAPGGEGPGAPIQGPAPVQTVATFTPGTPPPHPPPSGREAEFGKYDDVQANFTRTTAARAVIASRSPALFAIADGRPGAAKDVATMTPQQARITLGRALNETEIGIERAQTLIPEENEIEWRNFGPIHEQLWSGMPSQSGVVWSSALAKSVSKGIIGDFKQTEYYVKLGLSAAAAASLILSVLATAGAATVGWAAATAAVSSTGTAALSVQKYDELAKVAHTGASKDTRLVATEEVDEAQAAAILDTVFAFIDAASLLKAAGTGLRTAEAGARMAAREGLDQLGTLPIKEARDKLRTAIAQLGANETVRRSGLSIERLIDIAGGEATAEGKLLATAAKDASVAGPRAMGTGSGATVTAAARQLAADALPIYEQWAHLTPNERLARVMELRAADLRAAGVPVPVAVPKSLPHRGETVLKSWEIWIKQAYLDANITEELFAELLDTVTHETEHAMDMFGVAQMRINDGKTAAEVAAELKMRSDVALRAEQVQKGGSGTKIIAGSAREAELRGMYESVWGAGAGQRTITINALDPLMDDVNKAAADFDAAVKGAGGVDKLPPGDPVREQLAKAKLDAEGKYKAAWGKYRALAEEATAFAAGDAANAAMTERFTLLREFNKANADLKVAAEAWEVSTNAVSAATNETERYNATVASWNGYKNWQEAMQEARSTERALANADAGKTP
jgi:hypothetical protein